jgi:hypothetical protein
MTKLLHEVWEEPDGQGNWLPGLCLAGPDGEDFRKTLAPGARCVRRFEAGSHFDAMTVFHDYLGREPYTTAHAQDHASYPQEWRARQRAMSAAEVRAYGEVAQGLASHAYAMAKMENEKWKPGQFPDVPRPIYWHYCSSAFERVAYSLWRLEILRPIDERAAQLFAFDCELSDARDVAIRNARSGPHLSELIEHFIYLFSDYGAEHWGFSTEYNKPFRANGRLASTLESLAALGYLDESADGFTWTSLGVRAMYSTGAWGLPD